MKLSSYDGTLKMKLASDAGMASAGTGYITNVQ